MRRPTGRPRGRPRTSSLPERAFELWRGGDSYEQIAEKLSVTSGTAETYVSAMRCAARAITPAPEESRREIAGELPSPRHGPAWIATLSRAGVRS